VNDPTWRRPPARAVDTGTATVLAEVDGGLGVATLNRPERRNALHPDMFPALRSLLSRWADDDEVVAVVVTGAGAGFSAGGDVRAGRADPGAGVEDRVAGLRADAEVVVALHQYPKLTVAALNGAAVGAGLSLALACDLRVAAATARLRTGWIDLGLSGDFGGPWFLTRLLGPARALELLVGDEVLSAEAAQTIGLVNRVLPAEDFPDAARRWAAELASQPPAAVRLIKQNVRAAGAASLVDALDDECRRMVTASLTDDHRRAVRRWLDRRSADK